jgi:hypothetical protein
MKQQYVRPTVVRLGNVVEKTEGGWMWEVLEVLTKRAKG